MDAPDRERSRARGRGLRRVRGTTAWVASGAAALAIAFGGLFAAKGLTGTASAGTGRSDTGSTTQPGGDGFSGQQGTDPFGQDDGSGGLQQGGGGFQPPAQAPGWSGGGSGQHAQSGGS
jgi:hypothetical protein